MLNEIQQEAQQLRAELKSNQQKMLDKLLTILAECIDEQTIEQAYKKRDFKQLNKYKNLINGIYQVLNHKAKDPVDIRELLDPNDFWEMYEGENLLFDLANEKIDVHTIQFSDDFVHYMYLSNHHDLYIDGQKQEINGHVMDVEFFPNSNKYATTYKRYGQDSWGIMVDGHDLEVEFSHISKLTLNPNGQDVMYVGSQDLRGDSKVYLNKDPYTKKYQFFDEIKISENGQSNLIKASNQDGKLILINGKEWSNEIKIENRVGEISPNGAKVVVDGRIKSNSVKSIPYVNQKPWDYPLDGQCLSAAFSPDSQKLAASFRVRSGKHTIVIDKEVIYGNYKLIYGNYKKEVFGLRFTPDSKHIVGTTLEGHTLIYDDNEIECILPSVERDSIYNISPDSNFVIKPSKNKYDEKKQTLILFDFNQDKVCVQYSMLESYDDIKLPVFSPDSKKIIFIARKGSQYFRVVKNVEDFIAQSLDSEEQEIK